MLSLSLVVTAITLAFALVGVAVVFYALRPGRFRTVKTHPIVLKSVEMQCTVCQRDLVIHPNEMTILSAPEIGLIVSVKRQILDRPMAEYRCPYCEASHCFAVDRNPPEWITANVYEAQEKKTRCANCDTLLRRPEWPEGPPRESLEDYPNLEAEHGLVCSRCQSVSCYRCCKEVTKNRTPDGSFLCPRCSRGPVNKVFHF